jgi:predicted dehydrogenase
MGVHALTACLAHERIEVEDSAAAILEFANGAHGAVEASTCAGSSHGQRIRVQICGTEGSAFLADERIEVWDFQSEDAMDHQVRSSLMLDTAAAHGGNAPKSIQCHQHQRNFEEVVTAIRTGRQPGTSSSEARRAVELIQAIHQSAGHGGGVILL